MHKMFGAEEETGVAKYKRPAAESVELNEICKRREGDERREGIQEREREPLKSFLSFRLTCIDVFICCVTKGAESRGSVAGSQSFSVILTARWWEGDGDGCPTHDL